MTRSARAEDPRATYRTRREADEARAMMAGWTTRSERIDSGGHGRPYWVIRCGVEHHDGLYLYQDGYVR